MESAEVMAGHHERWRDMQVASFPMMWYSSTLA
jgi:hypothetical protein